MCRGDAGAARKTIRGNSVKYLSFREGNSLKSGYAAGLLQGLFLTAGVLEILFWSLSFRQAVLYMGQDAPVWYYGMLNFYGWPIESGPTGWGLNWAPLLLNLARFSGLFLVVCAAAFCLSGKSRGRWFLAYAVPTLPLALLGILISTADIHCRWFVQTVMMFHILFQPAFLLFAGGVLFQKGIRLAIDLFKAEKS